MHSPNHESTAQPHTKMGGLKLLLSMNGCACKIHIARGLAELIHLDRWWCTFAAKSAARNPHCNGLAELIHFPLANCRLVSDCQALEREATASSLRYIKRLWFLSLIDSFLIINAPGRASKDSSIQSLRMQLLYTVLVSAILGLFFPIALAAPPAKPTPSCPRPFKPFKSFPRDISLEFLIPRDNSEGESSSKTYDPDAILAGYYGAYSGVGWDIPYIDQPYKEGIVFRLQTQKLIPVGGSEPASLLSA